MKEAEMYYSIRTNHLLGLINYALEQLHSSAGAVNPLLWGDAAQYEDVEEPTQSYEAAVKVLQELKVNVMVDLMSMGLHHDLYLIDVHENTLLQQMYKDEGL